jgi:hypothetical protein
MVLRQTALCEDCDISVVVWPSRGAFLFVEPITTMCAISTTMPRNKSIYQERAHPNMAVIGRMVLVKEIPSIVFSTTIWFMPTRPEI